MFVYDEQHKGLSPTEKEKLVGVFHSVNKPKIVAGDRPAEATRAFICTFQDNSKSFQIQVLLYLTQTDMKMRYRPTSGGFGQDQYKEFEEEALSFVESMGFMMDNLNLDKLTPSQRKNALAALPIFEEKAQKKTVQKKAEEKQPSTFSRSSGDKSMDLDLDDVLALDELEAEFGRADEELAQIDKAIDVSESQKEVLASGQGNMSPTRIRTLVRFLASF